MTPRDLDPTGPKPTELGIGMLFWAVREAVIVADVESGEVVLWNPSAERLFGYTVDEALGQQVEFIAAPRFRAAHRAGMARYHRLHHGMLVDGGQPVEVVAVTKAGDELKIELTLARMEPGPDGKEYVLAVIRDVTARDAAEEESRRRGEAFRALAENSPDLIMRWDVSLKPVYANPAVGRLLGLAPEEVLVRRPSEAGLPPAVAAQLEQAIRQVFASGKPQELEFDFGSYFHTRLAPEPAADGSVGFVVGIMRDITARRRQEEALVERNAQLVRQRQLMAAQQTLTERIIQHVPVAIAYLDRELIYRWNNPLHAASAWQPGFSIVGRHAQEVQPPEVWARTEPLYRRVLETGETITLSSFVTGEDGHTHYLDASYVPVPDEQGEAVGILVLSFDVTERVTREKSQGEQIEALKLTEALKDQFLGILSHELRTPINAIMGYASILEDGVGGDLAPDQLDFVHRISTGADLMLALVNDLLDMSRIQAGRFTLAIAPCDLAAVLGSALQTVHSLADRKRQQLVIELPEALPRARCDGQRISQVLLNLVGNAIKFTPPGGTVVVRVRVEGDELRCEVVDSGPGIAAEDLSRLFKPFSQLDMSNTRSQGGSGLGLSIAKALVEAHGGEIGVETAPGAGATFWFTLPFGP